METQNQATETPAAPFRSAYPIDFFLYNNEHHQPVLYIDDVPDTLNVEIKNASTSQIDFLKLQDKSPSKQNCHFELCFRPGTLDDNRLGEIKAATDGWQISQNKNGDGTVSLFIITDTSISLASGKSLILQLTGVTPYGSGGTHGTRVELKYQNMLFTGSTEALSGFRVTHMALINHQGRKHIPLHVGILGSNKILNDGKPNELTLRITNILKKKDAKESNHSAITLRGEGENDVVPIPQSQFVISFDAGTETMEWALGTIDQISQIDIKEIKHGTFNIVEEMKEGLTPTARGGASKPEMATSNEPNKLEEGLNKFINKGTNYAAILSQTQSIDLKLPNINQGGGLPTGNENSIEGNGQKGPANQESKVTSSDKIYCSTLTIGEWTIRKENQGDSFELILTPNKSVELGPGDFIQITLENIITNHPTGLANLYVYYHNIPGYWDGHFTVPIEKSPMVFKGDNIGIGTDKPSEKLTVKGKTLLEDNLTVNGNVGIGINSPSTKLEVAGSVKATSFTATNGDVMVPVGGIIMWPNDLKNHPIPNGWEKFDSKGNFSVKVKIPNMSDKSFAITSQELEVNGDVVFPNLLFIKRKANP